MKWKPFRKRVREEGPKRPNWLGVGSVEVVRDERARRAAEKASLVMVKDRLV